MLLSWCRCGLLSKAFGKLSPHTKWHNSHRGNLPLSLLHLAYFPSVSYYDSKLNLYSCRELQTLNCKSNAKVTKTRDRGLSEFVSLQHWEALLRGWGAITQCSVLSSPISKRETTQLQPLQLRHISDWTTPILPWSSLKCTYNHSLLLQYFSVSTEMQGEG